MTRKDAVEMLNTGHVKPAMRDWYDMIMGTFIGMVIYGVSAGLAMMKLDGPFLPVYIYWIVLFVVIVKKYRDDFQITVVETGLSRRENLELLGRTFRQLGWPVHEYANYVDIGDSKYILKFIHATVIVSDKQIGYNFKYTSTTRSGRPAFFFGIRTYLKRKFESALHETLQSIPTPTSNSSPG